MRLHTIRLRNYRGVADCTVGFATSGVTIIQGDNEIGKSCIPEALDLILKRKDDSRARDIRALRPVDRDAGPEVEIEISTGDYRFVYSKRWYRRPQTHLDISAPRREQLSGREAHDRVEQILGETLDEPLWRALRIEQGAEVALPVLSVPSLGQALDRAAGGELTGAREDDLWLRICAEREKYWTPTGRVSAARQASENELEEADGTLNGLRKEVQDVEADAAKVEGLLAEKTRLTAVLEACKKQTKELCDQWDSTRGPAARWSVTPAFSMPL